MFIRTTELVWTNCWTKSTAAMY